jgi:hypothetical protein
VLTPNDQIFKYQDTNQEKVIHSGWREGNSYRYILEASGDIFRELTNSQPSIVYIREKIRRIDEQIREQLYGKIHKDDSFEYSLSINKDKFEKMKSQWYRQPSNSKIQKYAIELNLNMLNGFWFAAIENLNKIKEILGI